MEGPTTPEYRDIHPHRDELEAIWRREAPLVLAAVARRWEDFAAAEDAVQEALAAATVQWPRDGVPEDPRAWLVRVASRRMVDQVRSEVARRAREEREGLASADSPEVADRDDSLTLLLLCCHPALTVPSQVALTLRAVVGLTTAQVARAFLVPESTMGQRISRAKKVIRDAGTTFELPGPDELDDRVRAVVHVLYLVFTEGHTSTQGGGLTNEDLAAEAIRLARQLHGARPDDPEVAGLLALMLLTEARRPARMGVDGRLVTLAEQDRTLWRRDLIEEGVRLVTEALASGREVGPHQVQAAIAAVHDEAATAEDTDWPQVLRLYEILARVQPGPMVELNRAVAVAEVDGPAAGLAVLDGVGSELAGHHRWHAVRGQLLARAGSRVEAVAEVRTAARLTSSEVERAHLSALADDVEAGGSAPTSA
ncbi:MAG TPA: sigma-70 family RNA polymerase sigma factor [Intrasporangium sp.]|uniref:RNA polymerase sigma factor n=1 Tax=Intrasporangium sp. TaxID=1925024 RepID=UPI002B461F55|nr:sigma-70 family RNA polymerase sigma factor [Intrasporangium sp.]HKX67916.1 sigma-70 family RNA polymerase sigma factor [Intrasporangium sp.]